jgi:hypothetical protein
MVHILTSCATVADRHATRTVAKSFRSMRVDLSDIGAIGWGRHCGFSVDASEVVAWGTRVVGSARSELLPRRVCPAIASVPAGPVRPWRCRRWGCPGFAQMM